MSIQFLGMIGHRLASETLAPVGPILDKPYIAAFARAHEEACLLYTSPSPRD